ncbi:hypothetical protein SRHO_G00085950 [Serrasalmus rhombeus]
MSNTAGCDGDLLSIKPPFYGSARLRTRSAAALSSVSAARAGASCTFPSSRWRTNELGSREGAGVSSRLSCRSHSPEFSHLLPIHCPLRVASSPECSGYPSLSLSPAVKPRNAHLITLSKSLE